jgi:thiamine-triphosphatase
MIEVEIKVLVTNDQKQKLLQDAIFISEETLTDIYYDTDDFRLTTKGIWLRKRNEQFELKTPATQTGGFNINKNIPMHEFTNQDDIAKILNLNEHYKSSFLEAITQAGYKQLYKFTSTRQTYKKNKFLIDFDHTDFGDLTYDLCEIETTIEHKDQSQIALDELYIFAKEYNISLNKAEGKLGYYIKRKNPAHYYALEKASEKSQI